MSSIAAAASVRTWAALRVGVVLGAMVILSAVVQSLLAATISVPWVFPDELVYSEIARSLAAGEAPAVRGLDATGYGLVYPLLIAPAWWLFHDPERAYIAAKIVNATLVSLAALPAYALARRFVTSRAALVVAGLTLLMPSLAYSGLLITENAFLPVCLLSLLAMARALERPSVARELAVLLSIGLAVATRPKAVALLVAYVLAVLVYCALQARAEPATSFLARLRRYRVSLVLTIGGIAATALAPVLLLGAYASSAAKPAWGTMPSQTLLNVAVLDLFVGIVPFAAFLLIGRQALDRRLGTPALRELFALTLCVTVTFVLVLSSFQSAFLLDGRRVVNERNMFFLAPLFFIALMAWLERRPFIGRLERNLVVAACFLPVLLGIAHVSYGAGFQTLSLVPWLLFGGAPWSALPLLVLGFFALRVVLGTSKVGARPALRFVVGLLVLAALVVRPVMVLASERAHDHAFSGAASWINDAVGHESVAVLWREPGSTSDREVRPRIDHRLVWVNEFFNHSVGRVYALGAPLAYSATLTETPVALDDGGIVRALSGEAIPARFVLAPCQISVVGSVVAFDTRTGARLWRAERPVRVTALSGGCVERPGG